jgi:hypothetical protein
LALGDYFDADKGLPQKKTILIQRSIGLFFAVLRAMSFEETNEEKVQVIVILFLLHFVLKISLGTRGTHRHPPGDLQNGIQRRMQEFQVSQIPHRRSLWNSDPLIWQFGCCGCEQV